MKFLEHHYGPNVHILNSSFANGVLAQLCSPNTFQPQVNSLVETLYKILLTTVLDKEFTHIKTETETRMSQTHPDCKLITTQIENSQKCIVVNLARAGTWPSHLCYENLHFALKPENIRQDHIFAARVTNPDHHVTGAELGMSKIGGGKDKSIVLIPDPMGATGSTVISALDYYKSKVEGQAVKFIAMHLIITPEYLKNVLKKHPDLCIFALRLDRGLSTKAALNAVPGTIWEEEKGLNANDYIVPGGGGFGEIMNNAFV